MDWLNTTTPEKARVVRGAIREHHDIFEQGVDMMWLSEDTRENPSWHRCLKICDEMVAYGDKHDIREMIEAAGAAKVVILGEYLHQHSEAEDVAQEMINKLGHAPRVAVRLSTCLYEQRKYRECLDVLESNPAVFTPTRFLAMQTEAAWRALRCCAELEEWYSASKWVNRAKSAIGACKTKFPAYEPFPQMSLLAFKAEEALIAYVQGLKAEAVGIFANLIGELVAFPEQEYGHFHLLKLRFGHVLGWMLVEAMSKDLPEDGSSESMTAPYVGMFSRLEAMPDEWLEHKFQGYDNLWCSVAFLGASVGRFDLVDEGKEQFTAIGGREKTCPTISLLHEALFVKAICRCDLDTALTAGSSWAINLKVRHMIANDLMMRAENIPPLDGC